MGSVTLLLFCWVQKRHLVSIHITFEKSPKPKWMLLIKNCKGKTCWGLLSVFNHIKLWSRKRGRRVNHWLDHLLKGKSSGLCSWVCPWTLPQIAFLKLRMFRKCFMIQKRLHMTLHMVNSAVGQLSFKWASINWTTTLCLSQWLPALAPTLSSLVPSLQILWSG